MSTSSDERIQRHAQKQKEVVETRLQQEKRAADEQQRKNHFLADVRAKWSNDTHIVAEILKDFGLKLDGQLQFQDLGAPPPNTAAHGRITGRIGKAAPISYDLTVDEQGRLRAAKIRRVGLANVSFVSHVIVLDATREQYEDFILDLLDIEK